MKILWLTWKDRSHPHAGGAETVNEELAKRLVRDGHEVLFIVGGFSGGADEERRDGFRIVRVGGWYSVYWHAYRYYKKNLQGWADLVIEEVNTVPFFSFLYARKVKRVYLFYQLCRTVWFYQMRFPMNLIGYLVEPLYLLLLSRNASLVLTESQSAKDDLARFGFSKDRTAVFPIGVELAPATNIDVLEKLNNPTILSLGSIRPMKRTLDQVKAFELAKERLPGLKMKVAGDSGGTYGAKVLSYIKKSKHRNDIEYCGRVSREEKLKLMQECHVITVASVKEGWGLIVTEAASQGTPAVVYDVDGLRDSVRNGETGIIAEKNTPKGLSAGIYALLEDKGRYAIMRNNAWKWSKSFTFDAGYDVFIKELMKKNV